MYVHVRAVVIHSRQTLRSPVRACHAHVCARVMCMCARVMYMCARVMYMCGCGSLDKLARRAFMCCWQGGALLLAGWRAAAAGMALRIAVSPANAHSRVRG
jgi:hypothetical protein